MGIETERFFDNLPQEALCPICCLVLEEPVCTPCKHYVCQECWISWSKGASGNLCPYCCSNLGSKCPQRSTTIWKLVLNFNVYCKYRKQGCTAIYKLGLEDIHMKNCPFHKNNFKDEESCDENWRNSQENVNKCQTCLQTIAQNHNCIDSFLETVKFQDIKITNLEYENDRLSLRLTTKENGIMDQISELESRSQQDALNYEKEIRNLKTQIATLYGELQKRNGEIEEIDIPIELERQNGSLGLNIVGGHQEGKEASGIFISRIAENGAASKPGKLQLNDRVLEVNGVDLRNASHDEAVQAFRNSHGAVRIVVRRQVKVGSSKRNIWTQTDVQDLCLTNMEDVFLEVETNNNVSVSSSESVPSKSLDLTDSALPSGSEADDSLVSVNEHSSLTPGKSDLYDSAYDTLLTQKSSRSNRIYSLDESIPQGIVPLDENEDGSSECSEDIRTLTPATVINGYGSSSSSHRVNSSPLRTPSSRRGSLSTDDSLSPVHEVKMRHKNNGDGNSPRKVIRRSTYYLVEEPLDETMVNHAYPDERKQSIASQESAITSSSNDLDVEYEYEYEEVTIRKDIGSNGIQLFYGGQDGDLGVYISQIDDSCMVELSGSIMVGDQVIQINTTRVSNVEEACKILQENENITLVVARPFVEVLDHQNGLICKPMETLLNTVEESENEIDTFSDITKLDSQQSISLENISGSSSEISNATTNLSENVPETPLLTERCVEQQRIDTVQAECCKTQAEYCTPLAECCTPPTKTVEFEVKTETKSEIRDEVKASLKDYVLSKLRGQDKHKAKGTEASVEKPSTLERIKERTVDRVRKKDTPNATPSTSRKNSTTLKDKRKNSSSGSTVLGSDSNSASPVHKGVLSRSGSDSNNVSPVREIKPPRPVKSAMKKSSSKRKSPKHVRVESKPDWTLTEKRVWEEFKIIQNMEAEGEKEQEANASGVEAEWKVRRSKDGKHIYIRKHASKPQKSKLLKERAERLAVERTGITTDDDTNTIYLGRFWNKEERKRQLLRHRLKREKLLERQIAKDAILPNPMDAAMAEIVQKKMTGPGHVFDDFLTVEEILTQRNRGGVLDGPIHVTTV